MDPTAYTIETLLDFPTEEEDNKVTIVKHPSSSSTISSNPDELVPEKLEWIDDKDSFPSVDTFVGMRSTPPARIYKHLSPVSVLENNTVTIACDSLTTSATRSRRTSRGKKRVPAQNSEDPDYPDMPTHDMPAEELDLDSNGHDLKKKRKVTSSTLGRKCQHCEAKETPQWRAGPMGPKTLCNACGVRYKSGRLMPEYRPANSPTFSSKLHSNSHRKVVEMRKQKLDDVQVIDDSVDKGG